MEGVCGVVEINGLYRYSKPADLSYRYSKSAVAVRRLVEADVGDSETFTTL